MIDTTWHRMTPRISPLPFRFSGYGVRDAGRSPRHQRPLHFLLSAALLLFSRHFASHFHRHHGSRRPHDGRNYRQSGQRLQSLQQLFAAVGAGTFRIVLVKFSSELPIFDLALVISAIRPFSFDKHCTVLEFLNSS